MVESAKVDHHLPWLEFYLDQIKDLIKAGKLPKVILLHGSSGVGKMGLAHEIARLINFEPNSTYSNGARPADLFILGDGDSKISIDDIRELIDNSQQTANLSRYNVFIIKNCENMGVASANCLLKTLETDSDNSYFILTTDNFYKILPTILSRCFKLAINVNHLKSSESLYQWLVSYGISSRQDQDYLLEISGYAPLKVIEYHEDDYIYKLSEIKNLIHLLNNQNIISTHKKILKLFAAKKDKKIAVNFKSFIDIVYYYLMRACITDDSQGCNKNNQTVFALINKYKGYLNNNIAIDSSNAIYNILYSIAR